MIRTTGYWRMALGGMCVGAAALLASSPAWTPAARLHAQGTEAIDPRFQPWIGCWRTIDNSDMPRPASAPTQACVVPSAQVAGSVDVLLYSRDSLLSRNALPRAGTTGDKVVDDCQGRESAAWTDDGMRLIMRADLACARGVKRVETGMMTITPEGEWLQLQHLQVGSNEATTTVRFRYDAIGPSPAGLAFGPSRSTSSLRLAAGQPVNAGQVLDVSTHAPSGLTEAWLAELGLAFELDGKMLVELADRGMPPRVIDMMVAMSNPRAFSVRPNEALAQRGIAANTITEVPPTVNLASRSRCAMWDDFCYGPRGMGAWGFGWQYGYGAWDPWNPWYGFNSWRYGSRYGFPYGMGYGMGYGMPWGGGIYYGGGPVIVVGPPGSVTPQPQGRVIKGQGYTRGGTGGGGGSPATPRTTMSPSSGSSGGGSAPASTGSSGSSGSGGGSGRTAQPRPPARF